MVGACRDLVVKTWDSKLNADESKNGQIDACKNAFALVGSNALFNPDPKPMQDCPDKAGAATGLPDIAALANDVAQRRSKPLASMSAALRCEAVIPE